MKTLKITFALLAVLLLTVSGMNSTDVTTNPDEPTYKEYTPQDLVAMDKKKLKLQTQG